MVSKNVAGEKELTTLVLHTLALSCQWNIKVQLPISWKKQVLEQTVADYKISKYSMSLGP